MTPAGLSLSATLTPADALKSRLDPHKLADAPVRKAFDTFGQKWRDKAAQYAKPHGGDRGDLGKSIEKTLGGQGFDLEEKLFSRKSYANDVEFGQKAGRRPSSVVIGYFLRHHGGDPKRAWVIATLIMRRGTRGIFYLKRSSADVTREAGPIFTTAAHEIEANWGHG